MCDTDGQPPAKNQEKGRKKKVKLRGRCLGQGTKLHYDQGKRKKQGGKKRGKKGNKLRSGRREKTYRSKKRE